MNAHRRDFPRIPHWRHALLSVAVLLVCLFYTFAAAYLAPYPGVEVGNDLLVEALEPCAAKTAWCEANRNTLQIGDQLLVIGDLTRAEYRRDGRLVPFAGYDPGDAAPITFRRDGEARTVNWQMLGPTTASRTRRLARSLLTFAPFWLAGTVVLLFLQPRDRRWRLLVLFNYAGAIWLAAGVHSNLRVAYASLVQHALAWLLAPICLHLHLAVPSPLLRRHQRYLLPPLYATAATLAALELFQALPRTAFYVGLLVAFLGSFGVLVVRLLSNSSASDRVATRLMLAGIGLALGPGIVLAVIPALLGTSAPKGLALNVATFAIPLLPFFYTYAIYKHRLGGLEFRANRLLGLYSFILLYVTAFILIFYVGSQWVNVPDASLVFSLVVSTVFVVAALPLHARFRQLVDRLAYGTEHNPDDIAGVFANRISAASKREALVRLLADEVAPSLLIRQSALYLLADGEAEPVYGQGVRLSETPEAGQQIERLLAGAGRYRPPSSEARDAFDWVRLAVPVEIREEAVGVWLFGRRDPDDYYPQGDITLLSTLAGQVAVAVENARLHHDSRQRLAEVTALQEALRHAFRRVGDALAAGLSLEETLKTITDLVVELMTADLCCVQVVDDDEEGQRLTFQAASSSLQTPEHLLNAAKRLSVWAAWQDETLRMSDTEGSPRSISTSTEPEEEPMAYLGAPLTLGGKTIGILAVWMRGEHEWSPAEEELLNSFARQAAVAIERAQLYETAQERAVLLEKATQRLLALNDAALRMQEALGPGEVFDVLRDELTRSGLRGFLATLDDDRKTLIIRRGFLEPEAQTHVESALGIELEGHRLPLRRQRLPYQAIEERRAVFVADGVRAFQSGLPRDLRALSTQVAEAIGLKHAVFVPLLARQDPLGVLTVWSESLQESDVPALTAFANQAAVAIDNATLYEEVERRYVEMRALHEISLDITAQMEMPKLLHTILERACNLLQADSGTVVGFHPEGEQFEVLVSHGPAADYVGVTFGMDEGIAGHVMQTGQPLVVKDVRQWFARRGSSLDTTIKSIIAVPLRWQERIIGVLDVRDKDTRRTFDQRDLELLSTFADQAAIAMKNAQLFSEVAQERKKLEHVLQSVADGVYTTDRHLRLTSLNRAAERMTGIESSEALGQPCSEVLFTVDRAEKPLCNEENCIVRQAMRDRRPVLSTLHDRFLANRDGRMIPIISVAAPLFDEAGNVDGCVGAFWDVSREAGVERLKREFVSMVSHELRTPLTTITIAADRGLRSDGPGGDDEERELWTIVHEQSARLCRFVEQILDVTRLDAGQTPVNLASVAVNSAVERVMCRFDREHPTHPFEVDISDEARCVWADSTHLEMMLDNLVDNALKYSPDGSVIKIEARRTDDGMVVMSVVDQGMGISNRELARVFDKFYRCDSSDARTVYGYGLGLYIVKMLAELQGGQVWAESELGVGSRFNVALPAAEQLGE